jgi:phosphoribosylanthranilate isomerase
MYTESMITQVYEVTSPEEARQLCALGVDHVGVLVGDGSFPRELDVERAGEILASVTPPAKASVLALTDNVDLIRRIVEELHPPILHIGASPELVGIEQVRILKQVYSNMLIMRAIPVSNAASVELAKSCDGVADFLLLDSYSPGDKQIGALGITHDWTLDRQIVESVSIPVIIAGGLGPDNVADAIRATHPAGVDSKTKTDRTDGSHTKDINKVRAFVAAAKAA